jgi:uncharacterized protein (TIGR01777 family)
VKESLKVAISGASGLVGSRLADHLGGLGHEVLRLVRREPRGDAEVPWDPTQSVLDPAPLEGLDAFVHLSGASVAARWTASRRAAIISSRVDSTAMLARGLSSLHRPPPVLVCASAIGYYGDRGDEVLDEESAPGSGFLPELCVSWERAAEPARQAGIRVVHLRIGIVLSARGGALARMLPVFRLGLGGRLGSGRQYVSWISLQDLLRVVEHVIRERKLSGAVNAVAPSPVTNADFTLTLARVLRRRASLPVPATVLRLLYGEMARATILASARVLPARLEGDGFRFLHTRIEEAIRSELDLAPEDPARA